ncbi:MAG: gas vesicle protein GvpG [Desulfobaccales bacterium]
MFLLDDILLSPIKGIVWVAEKVRDAAQEESAREGDLITAELRELYLMLESGKISEEEFEGREQQLLDRLERLPEWRTSIGADEEVH